METLSPTETIYEVFLLACGVRNSKRFSAVYMQHEKQIALAEKGYVFIPRLPTGYIR